MVFLRRLIASMIAMRDLQRKYAPLTTREEIQANNLGALLMVAGIAVILLMCGVK